MSKKLKFLAFLMLLILSSLIGYNSASSKEPLKIYLNWVDAKGRYKSIQDEVKSGRSYILDVRTKAEYDEMHAVGAILFDIEKIKDGQNPQLNKDKKIYVYCRSGNRSSHAKKMLEGRGFQNITDLGGLEEMFDMGAVFERTPIPEIDSLVLTDSVKSYPIHGNPNAPVKMKQYFDFLCPYCLKYKTDTENQLIEKYVNGGKLSIEFINAPFKGADSVHISASAYCAHEQGKFWPFYNEVFNATKLQEDTTETENLLKYANRIDGINQDQFKSCVLEAKYVDLIRSQTKQARAAGVGGTPWFFINGQEVKGLISLDQFSQIIDQY